MITTDKTGAQATGALDALFSQLQNAALALNSCGNAHEGHVAGRSGIDALIAEGLTEFPPAALRADTLQTQQPCRLPDDAPSL